MEPSCFVTASSWGVAQGLIVSIGRAFRARGQAVYAYLCPRVCLWVLSSLGVQDGKGAPLLSGRRGITTNKNRKCVHT